MKSRTRRTLVDALLWLAFAVMVGFCFTKVFMAQLSVTGYWQAPRITRTMVTRVVKDPENHFTHTVISLVPGEKEQVFRMLQTELADVVPGQRLWLIANRFVATNEPARYRLSALRLLSQFPEPIALLLGLWAWRRFRRRLGQAPDQDEDATKVRVRLVDPSPEEWGRRRRMKAEGSEPNSGSAP